MVKVSVTEGVLSATAVGSFALFSSDPVQFMGKVFEDHTYYMMLAEPDNTPLSAWIPVSRSTGGIFVYADMPCDDPALEAYLSGVPSRTAILWLFDDTDNDYICSVSVTVVAAPEPEGLVRYSAVTALPAAPVAGALYYLSSIDTSNKAPIGVYAYNGSNWSCLSCKSEYDLGTWGGTTVQTLLPGGRYKAAISANLDAGWGIVAAGVGGLKLRITNGSSYTVATPAGTIKKRKSTALDDIAAVLAEWRVEYDGTTQDWDTAALV